MKIKILFLVAFFMFTSLASNANATFIETSASGTGDGTFTSDEYSYLFRIAEPTIDPSKYAAILTNTSPKPSESLIDGLAFNMNAVLNTDFTITDVSPDWTFSAGTGGVNFDYVGDADSNNPNDGDRLNPEWRQITPSSLTFSFKFTSGFSFPEDPFSLWTSTDKSSGTGIGGGNDIGQVAVSFQQLGVGGEESDLLASNWGGGGSGDDDDVPVPEPSTILLLGMGLALLGWRCRKLSGH